MSLINLDNQLSFNLYQFTLADRHPTLHSLVAFVATYFIYILPVALVWMFFWGKSNGKITSAKIFLMVIVAWFVFNKLIGSYLYSHYGFRDRPFAHFGIQELLLEQPAKSFPSDHAAVISTVVFGFFYLNYKKLGWLFLIGGFLASLARVMIGFHFIGDIVGGWLLGALAFLIVFWLNQPLTTLLGRIFKQSSGDQ